MQRLKHVAAVLGLIALAGAMWSFSVVTPASSAPEAADAAFNTVNITKIVNGPAAAGQFEVTISCAAGNTYVVNNIPANGTITPVNDEGPPVVDTPLSVDIPVAVSNLGPCSVAETNRQGAPATSLVLASPSATPTTVSGTPAAGQTGTITFAQGGNQTVNAVFTNTWAPAAPVNTVAVTKAVTGIPRPGSFWIVRVICDVAPLNAVDYNNTEVVELVFTGAGTQNAVLPGGACTPVVTEPIAVPASPAPAQTFTPPALDPFSLEVTTRSVTITNTYPGAPNTIVVNKVLRGVVPPASQWTVSVVCADAGGANPVAAQTFTYPAGVAGSHAFTTPAEKPQCTVNETAVGGATSTSTAVTSGPVTVLSQGAGTSASFVFTTAGSSATVDITNRYPDPNPANVLRVTKATTGTVPAGATYTVRVACGSTDDVSPAAGQQTSIDLTFGAAGGTQEVFVRSAGTPAATIGDCTVTETANGGSTSRTFAGSALTLPASAVTVTQDAAGPPAVSGSVVVNWPTVQTVGGDEAQATITKVFADNVLRIKKQLRGHIAPGASFQIRVRCTGGGVTDEQILTFTTNSFQEISVPANRPDCKVTEIEDGGAASVWYAASSDTAEATHGARLARVDFGGTAGQRAKVIVRNQFPGSCPRPGPKYC